MHQRIFWIVLLVTCVVAGWQATPTVTPTTVEDSMPKQTSFTFETVTVNERGEEVARETKRASQFVEDLGNGVTLEMVAIPAGEFWMGSPESEKERDSDEGPQRKVTVSAFYMSKYEITQEQ